MATYQIQSETLTDIADSIREKTGSEEAIATTSMSSMIRSITTGDPNAVLFVEQELTDEQKAQARTNIGAGEPVDPITPDWGENDSTSGNYIQNRTHWVEDGVYHTLSEEFIPETIARTSQIPEIPEVPDEKSDLGIYVTPDEPVDAVDGDIWFDTDEDVVWNGDAILAVDSTDNGDVEVFGTLSEAYPMEIARGGTGATDRATAAENLLNGRTYTGDLNEAMSVGTYWVKCPDCTNTPYDDNVTSIFGFLTVEKTSDALYLQTFTRYDSSEAWKRSYVNDAWTDWARDSRFVLLWENASPSSAFAAQTISLSLSNYELVAIEFRTTPTDTQRSIRIVRKGTTGALTEFVNVTSSSAYMTAINRGATVNSTGVTFAIGYTKGMSDSSTEQSESRVIPTRIYGIKGVN